VFALVSGKVSEMYFGIVPVVASALPGTIVFAPVPGLVIEASSVQELVYESVLDGSRHE